MTRIRMFRIAVASALLASAVAFSLAVASERSSEHRHASQAQPRPVATQTTTPVAGGEGDANHEASEHPNPTTSPAGHTDADGGHESGTSSGSEKLFGFNVESTAMIVAADLIVALLIALVLFLPVGASLGWAGIAIVAFGLATTALDIREAVHQHNENRNGLTTAAIGVGALHLVVAALALALLASWRRSSRIATPAI